MKTHWLKRIRVVFGIFFLLAIALSFIDLTNSFPPEVSSFMSYFQFLPSLVRALNIFTWSATGFLVVVVMTLIGGRVYCSVICPLGILQDVASYISKKMRGTKRSGYRYSKPHNLIRYLFFVVVLLSLLVGVSFFVILLDPFSVFGRIFSNLIRNVFIGANNILVYQLNNFNYYGIHPIDFGSISIPAVMISLSFFVLVIWFSITKGRLYCNTLCPVGTLLGFLSRISWFKITIDHSSCTTCGLCERVCKAECINISEQKVDYSRCVACYNCLGVCPHDSIHYVPKINDLVTPRNTKEMNPLRRKFLVSLLVSLEGFVQLGKNNDGVGNTATVPQKRSSPVSPPGSLSVDRFNDVCTACHLCVSACPTNVLQPSAMEYGLAGFLQPHMDNLTGFCNYDCVRCSQVCPTGAILPINIERKQSVQIGVAKFILNNCIVKTEGTDCGACAEHCPTKAVRMVVYRDNLKIPEVNPDICVGCGACEYACPTKPWKAIYVDGNSVHQLAQKPKAEKNKNVDPQEDFPF